MLILASTSHPFRFAVKSLDCSLNSHPLGSLLQKLSI
jgi:hypothetical protein